MIVYDQNFIVLVIYTAVDGFTFPSDWKKIRQSMLERRLEENNVSNLPPLLYAVSISAWSNQGSVMCLMSILNQ